MYELNLIYLLQWGVGFSALYVVWAIELKLAPVLVF